MRQSVRLTPEEVSRTEGGQFVKVLLPSPLWMPDGALATSVLVGRVNGVLRAYANVCRHHPLPLDYDATTVMGDDRRHLVCHQHGAVYRPDDGLCIDGPCKGEHLFPASVAESAGEVTVSLEG
jgi:nitrite reductase/ring-hydroxylating ferredoxin subunit